VRAWRYKVTGACRPKALDMEAPRLGIASTRGLDWPMIDLDMMGGSDSIASHFPLIQFSSNSNNKI
jgi:hypothetical protein